MLLIVGLGNPGEKYEKTRHNVGFRAIDKIAANFQFPTFQIMQNSEISKNQKIILVKPQTFMNSSGIAVNNLMSFYKIKPENLWVIHDDIDLPLGKVRVSKNRGAGGHKGVQSIIKELGTKNFQRIRIGICPPPLLDKGGGKPKNLEKSEHIPYMLDRAQKDFVRRFVLQKFTKNEEKILKKVMQDLFAPVQDLFTPGVNKSLRVNKSIKL